MPAAAGGGSRDTEVYPSWGDFVGDFIVENSLKWGEDLIFLVSDELVRAFGVGIEAYADSANVEK